MLHMIFGEHENVCYGPTWFKYTYEIEWFQDPFIQEMILEIDNSKYLTGGVIDSPVLGPIPPERLSGGLMTLIMIYEMPDKLFDATSCGPNCAQMLLEIGKRKEVTVNLKYFMPMEGLEPFEIEIVNTKKIVKNDYDYTIAALDCLNEVAS